MMLHFSKSFTDERFLYNNSVARVNVTTRMAE